MRCEEVGKIVLFNGEGAKGCYLGKKRLDVDQRRDIEYFHRFLSPSTSKTLDKTVCVQAIRIMRIRSKMCFELLILI